MLNYKITFVTCDFAKEQLEEWLNWVMTNIGTAETIPTIEEVTSNASYAKNSVSSPKWFDQQRLGG
jgi:hypothetical protein